MHGRGYPRSRTHVITNGVVVPPRQAESRRPATLVSLARWHPMKDFQTLLEAFREVVTDIPEARLVCAGFGVDKSNDELRKLINERRLEDAVSTLGPIDNVGTLLRAAKGLVISSRYGEALPMAGLEALALGTPVVTTDVGDTGELTVDRFQLVPAGNPGALAHAMTLLLTATQDAYEDLSSRSYLRLSANFDIRVTVERYDALYRSVRARRTGG
ncbi:glycosyltransferase [Blastococcus sp. TF02-9]|uniref:glycosyltransferase n=1 Tax=Blastococcus sp. TF02-09 TaxID=2250576 RepID=UPI0021007633|nr:glycosyltransferase [Blastococcus sp. TF02-9]